MKIDEIRRKLNKLIQNKWKLIQNKWKLIEEKESKEKIKLNDTYFD